MRKKENTHTQCVSYRILFSDIMAVMVLREYYVLQCSNSSVYLCMKGDNIKLQLLLLEFIHL